MSSSFATTPTASSSAPVPHNALPPPSSSSTARASRIASHSHIKGLGLSPEGLAAADAAGFIGQTNARECCSGLHQDTQFLWLCASTRWDGKTALALAIELELGVAEVKKTSVVDVLSGDSSPNAYASSYGLESETPRRRKRAQDIMSVMGSLLRSGCTEFTEKLYRVVKGYVNQGIAEVVPGVVFIDEVHILNFECFTYLNALLESPMAPTVVLATNRGRAAVRGADDLRAAHWIPINLLDRYDSVTDSYNHEQFAKVLPAARLQYMSMAGPAEALKAKIEAMGEIRPIIIEDPCTKDVFRELDGFLLVVNVLAILHAYLEQEESGITQTEKGERLAFMLLAEALRGHVSNQHYFENHVGYESLGQALIALLKD
ncbi:TIP49 C-terminus-domain-containing protein [Phellopilus nigrolimitatus]|nr:TIP49 C-terminus-domain-containing protein [Phellopilus nigrolimitatus]